MNAVLRQLGQMYRILWHPLDGFDELRFEKKGSLVSAAIILFLALLCRIFEITFTNFIFNKDEMEQLTMNHLLFLLILPFVLWVVSNYLVSSITKGQGTFAHVWIGSAYALSPYVFFSIPIAIVSNIFTMQEEAIYYFLYFCMLGGVVFLFYVKIMVVQGYEIFETFGNLLATLFTMAMIVIITLSIGSIFLQNVNYLYEIFMEVADVVKI